MDDRYFHSAFIYQGDAPEFIELIAALKNKIDSIQGLTPDIYIFGEFNIPHTRTGHKSVPTTNCNNQLLNTFQDFKTHMNINKIIHKPTHREGNILDFLMTNNTDSIFNYTCSPTVFSDHFIIDVTSNLNFANTADQAEKRNLVSKFHFYNFHSEKINWEKTN